MRKFAETLAKDYSFTTKEQYYNYIVESLINGHREQVRDLFNQMKGSDQSDFLINYLDLSDGYQKSTLNICITELCK